MQQISYADVAEVIARAETPEEREEAQLLLAAYYRMSPVVEPVSMRRRMLLRALQANAKELVLAPHPSAGALPLTPLL